MANMLDREALIIYLYNLRVLETALHINNNRSKELNARLENLNRREQRLPEEPSKVEPDLKQGCGCFFIILVMWLTLTLIIVVSTSQILEALKISSVAVLPFAIAYIVFMKQSPKEENEQNQQQYEQELSEYQQQLPELQKEKSHLQTLLNELSKEKSEIMHTLEDAYSADIIPLQFRNIEGIYYLYDYLSSSGESLTSALVQANLDEIKQRINQVTQLQKESIIQQAIANERMFQQNEKILQSLKNVEENSRIFAQYAIISALNSETSVRIQREQLTYQQDEYWKNH